MTLLTRSPITDLVQFVHDQLDIDPFHPKSLTRKRTYVYARFVCFWVLHRKHGLTQTGRLIGDAMNRDKPFDHATVLHGVKNINNSLILTDTFSKKIANIATEALRRHREQLQIPNTIMKFVGKVIDRTDVEHVGEKQHPKFHFTVEEVQGQYPQKGTFEVFGDKSVDAINSRVTVGHVVEVDFDLASRQSKDGKWWTSLKAWKVTAVNSGQAAQSTADEPAF